VESRRIAYVLAGTNENSESSGSGYLVGRSLVITAAHVVTRADKISWSKIDVTVGHPETLPVTSKPAELVWIHETLDVALIRLSESMVESTPVRWGRFTGSDSVPYKGLAFPEFSEYESGQGIEPLNGTVNPLGVGIDGNYLLDQNAAPQPSRHTVWGGASGAAVFSGDLLVGIVAKDDRTFGNKRLHAIPTYRLFQDPDFVSLIADDTKSVPVIESVELKSIFHPPEGRSIPGTPGSLLSATAEVVDFYGREDMLSDLVTWRDSAHRLSTVLVTSEGGQGKTRLAREFLRRSWPNGWVGGFLRNFSSHGIETGVWQHELSKKLSALRASIFSVLVVIDYAETHPDEIAVIAGQLLDEPSKSPVRLLLLSRNVGDWWENLIEEFPQDAARLMSLPALTANERPARQSAYATAVACFARDLPNLAVPAVQEIDECAWRSFAKRLAEDPPELTNPRFGNALTLQMTALANLISLASGEKYLPVIAGEEQTLVRHERDYLIRVAHRHGLLESGILSDRTNPDARLREAKRALERSVAGLVLLGPCNRDSALLIAALTSDRVAEDVAAWLATLYPPSSREDSYIGEVQPDRLAELLLGGILERQDDLLDELAKLITDYAIAQSALFTLTRTATHLSHASIGERIPDLIIGLPAIFAPPALILAAQITSRSPLFDGLIKLGELDPDSFKKYALAPVRGLPSHSTSLAYFSADLTQLVTDILRHLATKAPGKYMSDLSTALNDLANRLLEIGKDAEALEAIEDAVEIRRKLSESSPEEYEPLLVGSLNNLAVIIRKSGRRSDAVPPAREALSLIRRVYERESTEENLARLAGALNTLAGTLDRTTSEQEKIDSIEESIKHFRYLAKKDRQQYLPDLATALLTLTATMHEQGKYAAVVSASREAVKYFRILAREDPDAHLPDLADSLSNYAHGLQEIGRNASAIRSMDEAVRIRSQLAEKNPVHLDDLADSLMTLTAMLGEAGQSQRVPSTAKAAVRCYRTLAREDPDKYEELLADAIDNFALALASNDRVEEAVSPAREAVTIRTRIADQDVSKNPALAESTSRLANILTNVWQSKPTAERTEQIVAYFRFCVSVDRTKYLSGLVGSLINLTIVYFNSQDAEGAKEIVAEALAGSGDLNRDVYVDNFDLPDLAAALSTLSKTLLSLEEYDSSADAARESVRHFREVLNAGHKSHLRDFADALSLYASTLTLAGRVTSSIDVFKEAIEKRRLLVKRDKPTHLHALAMCLNDLAGILSDHGASAEAVSAAEEAVGYYRSLADRDPSYEVGLARGLVTYGHSLVKDDKYVEAIAHLCCAMETLKDAPEESKREVYLKAMINIYAAFTGSPEEVVAEFRRVTGIEMPEFLKTDPEANC
jgi:tetratricopeptide (TPR) repeat protein